MHKFTIFTIIFSIMVVFVVAELVINDYWGDDFASETQLESVVTETEEEVAEVVIDDEITEETLEEEVVEGDTTDPELRGDEEIVETAIEEPVVVESTDENLIDSLVPQLGLMEPILETSDFDGLIYGFWDVADDFTEFTVMKHKIFDGTEYVGTIYEIQTNSEIQTFGAYEVLRQNAETSESGDINENNAYGEASFYFNHSDKTNTVFLTFQQDGVVYSFEYPHGYHSTIRALIDLL